MKDHPSLINFNFLTSFFNKILKKPLKPKTVDELVIELIKAYDKGNKITHLEGRLLLHNIIEFGSLTVEDIMIPRNDIIAVNASAELNDILDIAIEQEYARLPIYDQQLDNIIGFVHMKDLLPQITGRKPYSLSDIIRPLLFAVPSMRILDLLVKMRSNRTHMAIVLDEYGSVSGLVTIEDLLEQIVGTIDDEHDKMEEPEIIRLHDNIYEANARISIKNLEETLGMNIFDGEEEDCETLAGLIFLLSGEVPKKGTIIHNPLGCDFEIIDADPRNLKRVRINITPMYQSTATAHSE
ncbi:hemolysin family protein [Rickettsiales endosymbiont of Stachyamoeba lipophora]|uniref:hemolysin family protein n=1 Tax=Rickettsiales endosymbiont of Stachyamoeba lipophora TaxID=2486578 RepID=UPI000F6478A0|nr:hemolysin family protein [Rickettsiales endosymbiont of Stachyamoeba lipophora]AZL15738.1 HlyC/CorC family transporter [Rickettsiales endosymbiont of Stachyamoeba lipophora]